MLFQINQELYESETDLAIIRNETSMFLRPPPEQNPTRTRRGASLSLAALAAVGFFGGVAMGN